MNWSEFLALRRRASDYTGLWSANGASVFRRNTLVGRMETPELARQVVDCHNSILRLVNLVVMLRLKRLDQEKPYAQDSARKDA